MKTTIYLVRHGEAEGNAFRRFHGQYDSLLTPTGYLQVEALTRRFESIHIDACYASDLTRTSLTARSIYVPKKLPLHRDKAFREVFVGRWEDFPFGHIETHEPEGMRMFNKEPVKWYLEGAETYAVYTGRFIAAMEKAIKEHEGGVIAIFCHGCVLRGVLAKLFYQDDFSAMPYCDNTAVSKLFCEDGEYSCEYLNDASHLPPEISTFARQKWWRSGGKDFNLWYQPMEELPEGLPTPERDWESYIAMLTHTPVGILSIRKNRVMGLHLLPQYRDCLMEDQLLGQAVSRCRKQGLDFLEADPACIDAPEVLSRYGFNPCEDGLWRLDIDRSRLDWSTPPKDQPARFAPL